MEGIYHVKMGVKRAIACNRHPEMRESDLAAARDAKVW